MTDDLQKPEVSLVKRLHGSVAQNLQAHIEQLQRELEETQEEAVDRIEQLVATCEALERERDDLEATAIQAATVAQSQRTRAEAAEAKLAEVERAAYAKGYGDCENETSETAIGQQNEFLNKQNGKLRAAVATLTAQVEAMRGERDDAISTLDAWFDRRKLGHEAVDKAVVDAASGYLRTSRVGGMPQEESDLILSVIQDMARLSLFADLFARAALTTKENPNG